VKADPPKPALPVRRLPHRATRRTSWRRRPGQGRRKNILSLQANELVSRRARRPAITAPLWPSLEGVPLASRAKGAEIASNPVSSVSICPGRISKEKKSSDKHNQGRNQEEVKLN
jgi:hypothetical protein